MYWKYKQKISNKVKDLDVKNRIYCLFDDIINVKNFDPNNIQTDEKSCKNILIYSIRYVTIKDSKYVKINSVNAIYLILLILPNWPNNWAVFWVHICRVHLTVCFCYVTYAFQSESTLCSCLNVKELLARSRREIWSLSDCNWTWTQNHLVRKRTLNSLAKLTKLLSCVLNNYLHGIFDCMFLSCQVCIWEWILNI